MACAPLVCCMPLLSLGVLGRFFIANGEAYPVSTSGAGLSFALCGQVLAVALGT